MEDQKVLNELFIDYIRENQRVIGKLAGMVNEEDKRDALGFTKNNDNIVKKIEKVAQITIYKPNI